MRGIIQERKEDTQSFFVQSFLHLSFSIAALCGSVCSLYFSVRQGDRVHHHLREVDVHLLTPHPALASAAPCSPVSSDHRGKPPIIHHCSKEPIISHDYTGHPPKRSSTFPLLKASIQQEEWREERKMREG